MDLTPALLSADRRPLSRFIASLIHELTVHARGHYGSKDGADHLARINETIHRLSGHLRDLSGPDEVLTASRAHAIALASEEIGESGLARILGHSPL